MQNTVVTATKKWDTVVDIKGVTKYFDQNRPISMFKREKRRIYALKDVSFSLQKGEFAAYAGPNGAGKSTTFKLLAGMLCPQEGNVRIFGMEPNKSRIPVMRRTGILFGNRSELWWDHPVRASFAWKKEVWDIKDADYHRVCEELKDLLSLGDLWNSYVRELSLGQRMRANLALMLLHEPELVLLDEPTLGLDVLAKRQMIEFLKKINQDKQVTILVTSHDMDDLTEMANRILLINEGQLAFDGDYEQLIRMTGDNRIIKLSANGDAPALSGATYVGTEEGKHLYRYDASQISVSELFGNLSKLPAVEDVELGHEAIEQVIAKLYENWKIGIDKQ